jgi:beta-glucanase (GH16 family)
MIRTLFLLLLLPLFACQPGTEDNWQLVWSDEFDGPAINEENWSFEIGDGCPNLCGWGNNELQYYTQENAQIVDGHLVITAQKDSMGGQSLHLLQIGHQRKARISIRPHGIQS